MAGLRDRLAQTSSARRFEETIGEIGKVLFAEPVMSELEAVQKKFLKYKVSAKGKNATVEMDPEASDVPSYTRSLIALTVRDPDTGERVFADVADVNATLFEGDEHGAPRHGSELYEQFARYAQRACGVDLPDDEKKKTARKN